MSAQENLRTAQKIYENFKYRNIEDSFKYISEDVIFYNIPFGTSFKGKDGFRKASNMWTNTFSDAKVNIKNMISGEDYIVTEFNGTGIHDGIMETPAGKINPTYNKVKIPFVEVLQFRNGKVVGSNLYFDSATIMQQLEIKMEKAK